MKDPFFGNMVQIEHKSSQMKTLYGHLKNHADGLQVGKEVKRYDIIGYVGNSGRSTGDPFALRCLRQRQMAESQNHIILDDSSN